MIDYLQLLSPEDRRTPREQQVAQMSRGLKCLAKDLEVPVICLAQLNRGVELRNEKKPILSDLRESGAIEQDADIVWFIDRPSVWSDSAHPTDANLHIAKNRNGQTGCIRLRWLAETLTFRNAALWDKQDAI